MTIQQFTLSSPPARVVIDGRPGIAYGVTAEVAPEDLAAAVAAYVTNNPGTVVSPAALEDHVLAPAPHPAYDDMQDLAAVYRSRLT